jgi:hypothetical protein
MSILILWGSILKADLEKYRTRGTPMNLQNFKICINTNEIKIFTGGLDPTRLYLILPLRILYDRGEGIFH